ncbi:tetraspanin family protein [Ancylostoma duodenale]|uniref:Tetraspanin family protein n=1 Tax=Ancylostoma duodenale TaxID=51022 RepID=A0A0C2GFH3_9BILA|nr:tetraspanin family protein [Ancylostoma duodenale]
MLELIKKISPKYCTKRRAFFATLTVFTTMGIYSLAVGVWLYLKRTDFYELTPTSFSAFSTAGLCCSTGVAVCIICTVGWIAATAYNRRLLLTYIGFVVLLAIIQTVTGILGLSYKEAAREHVRLDLLHNINRTALVTSQGRVFDLTASWDKLQKSLKCCGVNNASDWHYSRRWPSQQFVPDSCCDPEHFSDVVSMGHCGKVDNSTILYQQLSSLGIAVSLVNSESFFAGSSGKSRDEYHRCLVELNEMDARDLRVQPMDRIGDARQDPLDNVH